MSLPFDVIVYITITVVDYYNSLTYECLLEPEISCSFWFLNLFFQN